MTGLSQENLLLPCQCRKCRGASWHPWDYPQVELPLAGAASCVGGVVPNPLNTPEKSPD